MTCSGMFRIGSHTFCNGTLCRRRFYYGWVVVAVSFITLFMALGIRYAYGVFFVAIVKEYGWSRGATAGAFSMAMISHALFAPVTGMLIDRYGPRRLFPLGAIFLTSGLIAASRISSLWHLYLFFGVVIASGINTLSYSPHMSIIPKWFVRKRGLASGLVLSGIGMGTMALAPLCETVIESLGWRAAFLVLAALVFGIVFPLTAIFHRRSPQDVGQCPEDFEGPAPSCTGSCAEEAIPSGRAPKLWTLDEALRTGAFWHTTAVVFCNGVFINMLLVHQVAHVVDAGFSTLLAASVLGLVGLIGSAGGIFGGLLSDRIGRELSYTLGSALAVLGILLLLFVGRNSGLWMLYGFVMLYGVGYGSMLPVTASTTGDLFPGNSLGRILAIQSIGYGLGGALGPYLGGYFYDLTGTYAVPFLIAMLSVALGVYGIWMAAPRRARLSR